MAWIEIAPGIKRVAMIFNPDTAPFVNSLLMPVFETAAKSFNIAPISAPVHSDAEIETVINSLGREPGAALFVTPDSFLTNRRATIISLAARKFAASFDVVNDFEPISLIADCPMWLVGRNSLPAKNLAELVAWLKENPDKATVGISGVGGALPPCCGRRAGASGSQRCGADHASADP